MEGRRDVLWSSPFEGHYLMSILPRLAISEIMYHPAVHGSGGPWSESDFEFIEIQSLSSEPVNLVGIRITGGIRFDIPNRILAPGDTALVVGNRQAFLERYPELLSRVVGEFEGDLSNRGEAIRIEDVHGRLIFHVDYEDRGDWYSATDGEGFSLEWNGQILEETAASSWKVSSRSGGSPGWVEVDSLVVKDLKVSGKRIEMTVEGNFVGSVAVQRSASVNATNWDTVREIHLGPGMNSVEISEPLRLGSNFYRVRKIERDQQ